MKYIPISTAIIAVALLAGCEDIFDGGDSSSADTSSDGAVSLSDGSEQNTSIDANQNTDTEVHVDAVADSGGTVNIYIGTPPTGGTSRALQPDEAGSAIDQGKTVIMVDNPTPQDDTQKD